MDDREYMKRAIELAKRGSGHVNPNPMVGAVLVRDGEILGEGWHERCGGLHAERNAIAHARAAGHDLKGSTIYVTLEPCCHYGKTPPCTEAILEEGISRVVAGSDDPNPLVAGKGFRILREHGVEVESQFMKEECDSINDVFFHYIQTKMPFVAMKYAMTMDGKIACYTGESKWVTGSEARNHVQRLRNHYKGIMAGIGTVLADDPMLSCRMEGGRDPVRIICDDYLRIPMDSQLVRTAKQQPLVVACLEEEVLKKMPEAAKTMAKKAAILEEQGVTVLRLPAVEDEEKKRLVLSLPELMKKLGEQEIDGILLEGGGTLNENALRSGIVSGAYCYIAPKIFGGAAAKTPVEGRGVALPAEAWQFVRKDIRMLGQDILIEYRKS
ncbi:MAG: bifunctional diaminohydroxyphosphoribosylaminopyrimidine deaminase/5-amino-6-(5-phosphoribosylamino)uracil reductase RibD [Eubacteriales bacterium]|nr:bifunctional diaminohydroxyphosphoribosylaminopyrimidine deaminase/5-amino-6-(5-phosphoribosylamino)uracil reductase RibD [Eubacteriales bacterium]